MGDIQLGVGNRSGIEKIIHLTNVYLSQESGDVVLLDLKNAFNAVSRTQAFLAFDHYLPRLSKYIRAVYADTPLLWLRMEDSTVSSILSQEGAQKGDPLGPLLFAIVTLPLLRRLEAYSIRRLYHHH
jgi:hypothetical protein